MHGALMQELAIDYSISIMPEPVCWRALLVESGTERKACGWLRDRQFKPYWARYRVEPTRIQERRHVRWKSVIPGYVFLPIPLLRPIDSDYFEHAPGIRGFMRNGSHNVVRFTEEEIEQVRKIEEALRASLIAAVEGIPFRQGQKVRIIKPDLEARIKEITSKRKIVVEAMFLGAMREWQLAGSEIEAI